MNSTFLARYNAQKRHTLDRVSLKYQLTMRETLRRHAQAQVAEIYHALEAGVGSPQIPARELHSRMTSVFEKHRSNVIYVGVSDGIHEISPEGELNLWDRYPVLAPVEETLSTKLASHRDKVAKDLATAWARRHQDKVPELAKTLLGDYLDSIKKAYKILADSWIAGTSDEHDVIASLKVALMKTDSSTARIFRTETTTYFNQSRHTYFSQNTDADYIELYAVTDGRISQICEDRHQFVLPMEAAGLKKWMPAFHPHCRTIQRPLISMLSSHKTIIEQHLGSEWGGPVSDANFTPLPKNWAA